MMNIFVLLVMYQIKHFIADYPLQGKYMLGKFKPGWDFLGPLSAHCGVHAWMTGMISAWYLGWNPYYEYRHDAFYGPWLILGLMVFDFVSHFCMDRIKAGPKWLGRFKPMSGPEYMSNHQKLESVEPLINAQQKLDAYDLSNGAALKMLLAEKEECEKKIRHNAFFWWSLGLDQMWHHLTHYAIIAVLLNQ